jgi:hypothetical protein
MPLTAELDPVEILKPTLPRVLRLRNPAWKFIRTVKKNPKVISVPADTAKYGKIFFTPSPKCSKSPGSALKAELTGSYPLLHFVGCYVINLLYSFCMSGKLDK